MYYDIYQEIELRAKNNYGSWHNEQQATDNVHRAIFEILAEYQDELMTSDQVETLLSGLTAEVSQ